MLATGPGHGIQLKNGRLPVPVWLSTGTGGHAHRPSVTATIFSDDGGKTWHGGDIAVTATAEIINPNETTAAQLADGRVLLNVRSESKPNRRILVTSPNGATEWSTPRFHEQLLEPICMAGMVPHDRESGSGEEPSHSSRTRTTLNGARVRPNLDRIAIVRMSA